MSVGSVHISTRTLQASEAINTSSNTTQIDLRISHPMENGARKDAQGVVIPAWHLTRLEVFHNDKKITELALGPLVARNPAVSLALNGGSEEDVIKILWSDNRGESGESSTQIN